MSVRSIADYHNATLPRGEHGVSSPRLPLGLLLLLAIHHSHAIHPSSKHLGIEDLHPYLLALVWYHPVLFRLPSVCFVAFVIQAQVLPLPLSKLLLLMLIEHLVMEASFHLPVASSSPDSSSSSL